MLACVHFRGTLERYWDTSNGAGGEASYEDIQYAYQEYSVYAAAGLAGETEALGTEVVDFGAFLLPVAEGALSLSMSAIASAVAVTAIL
jgi:hypothetical protein